MLGGCEALPTGIADGGSLTCNGTEHARCDAVAELAIVQMNMVVTGPITNVTLAPIDCATTARTNFLSEVATSSDCWDVAVSGERSHGGGIVALFPNGALRPYWRRASAALLPDAPVIGARLRVRDACRRGDAVVRSGAIGP